MISEQNTVLVRMDRADDALEQAMRAVSLAKAKIENMNARASVDGSTLYLTIELAKGTMPSLVRQRLEALPGIRSVEMDENSWVGPVVVNEPMNSDVSALRVDLSAAYR